MGAMLVQQAVPKTPSRNFNVVKLASPSVEFAFLYAHCAECRAFTLYLGQYNNTADCVPRAGRVPPPPYQPPKREATHGMC